MVSAFESMSIEHIIIWLSYKMSVAQKTNALHMQDLELLVTHTSNDAAAQRLR